MLRQQVPFPFDLASAKHRDPIPQPPGRAGHVEEALAAENPRHNEADAPQHHMKSITPASATPMSRVSWRRRSSPCEEQPMGTERSLMGVHWWLISVGVWPRFNASGLSVQCCLAARAHRHGQALFSMVIRESSKLHAAKH